MNLEQYIEERNKFLEIKNELTSRIEKYGQLIFRDFFDEYFKKYDFVENVSWTQYTPYFNDGEPCVFSVNTYDYEINVDDEKDSLRLDEYISNNKDRFYRYCQELSEEGKNIFPSHEAYSSAYNDLNNFMKIFEEEHFQLIFGDHSRVVVKKTKLGDTIVADIEVEEYEHD